MLIDSDPLEVGTEITIVGVPRSKVTVVEVDGIKSVTKMSLGWNWRNGVISAVLPRSRLTRTPIYETTIQAPGGMSGGPAVVNIIKEDRRATSENIAVGLLSHDLPDEESESVYRSGCSYVIPAASFYGVPGPRRLSVTQSHLPALNLMTDVGKRKSELTVDFCADERVRRN
jgi:hypothetical protein